MSLINDALKRAREAHPSPRANQASAPVLQPVEYTRHSHTGAVYVSAALLVVGLGAWFLVRGWEAIHQAAVPLVGAPVNAREPSTADAASKETRALGEAEPVGIVFQPEPVQPSAFVRDFSVEDTPPATAAVTAATAPLLSAPSPGFRLQAIFYRASSPSAVINGRTVFVGDRIDDAKITAIAREAVTLQAKGETKVLTLY